MINEAEYDLVIFMAAHKDFISPVKNKIYKIITDDENSLKNKYDLEVIYTNKNNELYQKKIAYGETSKLYYIWKNYKSLPKYIGLNHYRTHFKFMDKVPNMDKIFAKYDVILPIHEEMKKIMKKQLPWPSCILNEIIQIIKEIKPEYFDSTIDTMYSKKMYWKNIFIMKKEDFLQYGQFVFDVLKEFDKRHNLNTDEDVKNYILQNFPQFTKNIDYKRRLEGFILERVSNIFYTHKFKKVYELELVGPSTKKNSKNKSQDL